MADLTGFESNQVYTGAFLRQRGFEGVVGNAPDDATFLLNSQGGWQTVSPGTRTPAPSGGGGSGPRTPPKPKTPPKTPKPPTPKTPPTTVTPPGGGGGDAGAGAGTGSLPSMGSTQQVSMGGDFGGGEGSSGTQMISGISRFRQGIGQRNPPVDSQSLAALRKIY